MNSWLRTSINTHINKIKIPQSSITFTTCNALTFFTLFSFIKNVGCNSLNWLNHLLNGFKLAVWKILFWIIFYTFFCCSGLFLRSDILHSNPTSMQKSPRLGRLRKTSPIPKLSIKGNTFPHHTKYLHNAKSNMAYIALGQKLNALDGVSRWKVL